MFNSVAKEDSNEEYFIKTCDLGTDKQENECHMYSFRFVITKRTILTLLSALLCSKLIISKSFS